MFSRPDKHECVKNMSIILLVHSSQLELINNKVTII